MASHHSGWVIISVLQQEDRGDATLQSGHEIPEMLRLLPAVQHRIRIVVSFFVYRSFFFCLQVFTQSEWLRSNLTIEKFDWNEIHLNEVINLVSFICETESVSKQNVLIMVICTREVVQWTETMLFKLASFPYIHWVGTLLNPLTKSVNGLIILKGLNYTRFLTKRVLDSGIW